MTLTLHASAFRLGVVILAAGRSARMGRPKLLLPWGKTSVIGHLIEQWRNLGAAQIAVVCAARDQGMQTELDRLGFPGENRPLNPEPERGMFSSIQRAARWPGWAAALTHWAIVLGDQPHLLLSTLQAVLEFSATHPNKICLPRHGRHRRHPVLLPRLAFTQLANSPAADLKAFLGTMGSELAFCELDDPGLDLDIDQPEDYEHALRMAQDPESRP